MNKKLKKMLAAISAVAMCTVSMTAISSNAIDTMILYNNFEKSYVENNINYYEPIPPNTRSFFIGGNKYILWESASEYMKLNQENYFDDVKMFRKDGTSGYGYRDFILYSRYDSDDKKGMKNIGWTFCNTVKLAGGYSLMPEDADKLKKYLSDNNIDYEESINNNSDYSFIIINDDQDDIDYRWNVYLDIYKKFGFEIGVTRDELGFLPNIKNVEIPLPEPTLIGDPNEDNKVTIADAVLIMQSLSSPDDYQITPQGIANADINNDDSITNGDAVVIQEGLINKGRCFYE